MLEPLVSGFLSLWIGNPTPEKLKSTDWSSWINPAWITSIKQLQPVSDAIATAAVQQHLIALTPLGMARSQQGVWIQTDQNILADNQGMLPLSAASLTKIVTTLVATDTWGVDHQFETLVGTNGTIENGVLKGDLIVKAGGDPLFVWEEAIALGNALQQRGIRRVEGNLLITSNFAMNFQLEPIIAGTLLKQGINSDLWSTDARSSYQRLPGATPQPKVVIGGEMKVISSTEATAKTTVLLVRHRSLPLSHLLKQMNTYSNNMMAEFLANQLGGATAMAQKAASLAGVPAEEIQLINGSGLGDENRISARAICAMLTTLQTKLQFQQMNVADLFPVMGQEQGTVRNRRLPAGSAVKTGTLNNVSSLAGVIPTRDRGLVWFAIINVGYANLSTLRSYQDILLQTLQQAWGAPSPIPPALTPSNSINAIETQLGSPDRNQILYRFAQ